MSEEQELEARRERELEEARRDAYEETTPCPACGYLFNVELLGRYGCPNCHGEGLE